MHQRVALVRRRGTLSVGLRRVVRVLHASAVHAPGVQHRADRGHCDRGRIIGADRTVVPAIPVGVVGRRENGRGVHQRVVRQGNGNGSDGGRVRRGLLT